MASKYITGLWLKGHFLRVGSGKVFSLCGLEQGHILEPQILTCKMKSGEEYGAMDCDGAVCKLKDLK